MDTRRAVSISTGSMVKKLEAQLMETIAACEEDLRLGNEDLARLKEALRSLRRQKLRQKPVTGSRHEQVSRASTETASKTGAKEPTARREREGSAASIIRSFVRQELRQAARPLTRSDILDRLDSAGVQIDAKSPIKRIAKVMWSSDEFVNVGDGYWFAGEPVPDPKNDDLD